MTSGDGELPCSTRQGPEAPSGCLYEVQVLCVSCVMLCCYSRAGLLCQRLLLLLLRGGSELA